jgi:hypothetical protein
MGSSNVNKLNVYLQRCPCSQDAGVTQAGEQVILVGAASKGIIQRGFQHNATVYKTPYAKNPFDAVTDDDLEEYKRSVQRHTKGESCESIVPILMLTS